MQSLQGVSCSGGDRMDQSIIKGVIEGRNVEDREEVL